MKQLILLIVLLLLPLQISNQSSIKQTPKQLVLELPIGTQKQYDHVVEIYQSLIDKGVHEHAAFELVNQKVAEKGWTGYATGDNKKYNNVDKFTDHLIEWHGRMYPKSLTATTFEEFWDGIQVSSKYKYNPFPNRYRKYLLKVRLRVLKIINYYRQLHNLELLK